MSSPSGVAAGMRWVSAFSPLAEALPAAEAAAATLTAALGEGPVDLAMVFLGAHHVAAAAGVAEALKQKLAPACLIGASAHGVITSEHEVETGPGLTVIAARLPGVALHPFVLTNEMWAEASEDALTFARAAPGVAGAELVVLFGDPFSLDIDRVLATFNRHAPGLRVIGGMASAGAKPGTNALLLNDWLAPEGGVGLAFKGALRADVIVSQGCRPVGPPLEVTRADGNVVIELDGQPALERAEQVLRALSPVEREKLAHGLYIGRPARQGATGRGDYLIRNLLGADRDRGLLAIGDRVTAHEKIRIHVRDAGTAKEDLELLLSPQAFDSPASAALVFACNGRGRGLYGRPDGDISILRAALGEALPAAGMFCAGEIGPVGEKNFVHGHTACIALMRPGTAKGS
jgi:small ligand-binding sensory domain FIST